MALLKEDRIAFSKKIVTSDLEKAAIEISKSQLQKELEKVLEIDAANKRLIDEVTFFINPYQNEYQRYDGNFRNLLVEQDFIDSANFVSGNAFYPNDPQNPPLSLAPNVWTKTKPYARTKAIGKKSDETFVSVVNGEIALLTTIINTINKIENDYSLLTRVTGERCITVVEPDPDLTTDYTTLLNAVNTLLPFTTTTQSTIWTADPDSARQALNNAAISDINNIISAINTWLALTPFVPSGASSCTAFNLINPTSLGPTRLQAANLTTFKNAASSRLTFVNNRFAQIGALLGNINQNLTTADATGSGWYYQRWNYILLRLNLLGGSLIEVKGFERGMTAQDQQIANVDFVKNTYLNLVFCSALSAPANGTKIVYAKDSSGFSVGDQVFIISDDQEELVRSIQAINGPRITLGESVPAKYRPEQNARIYKDLT